MSKRKIELVVVVGGGFIAVLARLPNWKRFGNVELNAICDVNGKRASSMSSTFSIPRRYTNTSEMLDKECPDLVDICTPPASHAPLVRACLSAGYSCAIEKPLAVTIREVDQLISISRKTGAKDIPYSYRILSCRA